MTESEWLASDDPRAMLEWCRDETLLHPFGWRSPSDRMLRLFACACAWQPWQHPLKDGERGVVLAAERMADDPEGRIEDYEGVVRHAERMGLAVLIQGDGGNAARKWCEFQGLEPWFVSRQAAVLRDLVGNPWRPVTLPPGERACYSCDGSGKRGDGWDWYQRAFGERAACLQCDGRGWFADGPCPWLTTDALSLATAAYEDRLPDGALDPVRLMVLADAMEEAGCEEGGGLLAHLRGQCPVCKGAGSCAREDAGVYYWPCEMCDATGRVKTAHYRGCHVLDLILGRE